MTEVVCHSRWETSVWLMVPSVPAFAVNELTSLKLWFRKTRIGQPAMESEWYVKLSDSNDLQLYTAIVVYQLAMPLTYDSIHRGTD